MAIAKKSKSNETWGFSFDGTHDMGDIMYGSLDAAEKAAKKEATEYLIGAGKVEFFKLMKTVEVTQTVEFKEVK